MLKRLPEIQKQKALTARQTRRKRIKELQEKVDDLEKDLKKSKQELEDLIIEERNDVDEIVTDVEVDKVQEYLRLLYETYKKDSLMSDKVVVNKPYVQEYINLNLKFPNKYDFIDFDDDGANEMESEKLIGADEYYKQEWDTLDDDDIDKIRKSFEEDRKVAPFPPPQEIQDIMKKMKVKLTAKGETYIFIFTDTKTTKDFKDVGPELKFGFLD